MNIERLRDALNANPRGTLRDDMGIQPTDHTPSATRYVYGVVGLACSVICAWLSLQLGIVLIDRTRCD
jgi:hypothetical protein